MWAIYSYVITSQHSASSKLKAQNDVGMFLAAATMPPQVVLVLVLVAPTSAAR